MQNSTNTTVHQWHTSWWGRGLILFVII